MMNGHNSNHHPPATHEGGASLLSRELSGEHEALLARIERILANSSDDLRSTLIRGMLGGIARMAEQPPDLLDVKIMRSVGRVSGA